MNTLLFVVNFEQLLIYLNSLKPRVPRTVDFNVRSSRCWSDDIDTIEGA